MISYILRWLSSLQLDPSQKLSDICKQNLERDSHQRQMGAFFSSFFSIFAFDSFPFLSPLMLLFLPLSPHFLVGISLILLISMCSLHILIICFGRKHLAFLAGFYYNWAGSGFPIGIVGIVDVERVYERKKMLENNFIKHASQCYWVCWG